MGVQKGRAVDMGRMRDVGAKVHVNRHGAVENSMQSDFPGARGTRL